MTTYIIRRALEQIGVDLRDRRHIENNAGSTTCGAASDGAFVADNSADADCIACRLLVLGPGGLN